MNLTPELIGQYAFEALEFEARLTPKPGLVDAENNGAHADMDLTLLLKSAATLQPHFTRFAVQGMQDANDPPSGKTVRHPRGTASRRKRRCSLQQTAVNTHKGAIFLLGILCYAAERRSMHDDVLKPLPTAAEAALICHGVSKELERGAGRAYKRYGATGARGEAEGGYPLVLTVALPAYHEAIAKNASEWDAWLLSLLRLIEHVDDANVLARCGESIARELRSSARNIANRYPSGGPTMLESIRALDEKCRMWQASPGGSADLLACAYFLNKLEQQG